MSWAEHYIKKLQEGETVQFRPRGNSMEPKISSGDLCTVEPILEHPLDKGDIVLCTVKGNDYLHLVQSVQQKSGGFRYQICNNKKYTNGIIGEDRVYGKLIKVEG
jgi:phage repressor protein C with HTH and peptisase S24 domain